MKELFLLSEKFKEEVPVDFIRDQIRLIDTPDRLIGIKGCRGVGKTTLLLQYLKTCLKNKKAIYISLDDIFFTEIRLIDFIDDFVKNGGTDILVDEVHKYPNWSLEIKNAYDRYKDLKIVFTGSSILKIRQANADLSRRAVVHSLQGLSLREYINLTEKKSYPVLTFEQILSDHRELTRMIWKELKPLKKFNEYLTSGYYPFFLENPDTYQQKLRETIMLTLETDLPSVAEISYSKINKIKQLLYIISTSVPFKPNIQKLSERTGISRNTLKNYLHLLNEAKVIGMLFSAKKGISVLTKPEKIYFNHPNQMVSFSGKETDTGTLRETFFYNQVSQVYPLNYTEKGDFLVDRKYTFEVGGKNKTKKQIAGLKNAFLALDGIESGYKNEIPLWLFGFLY